MKDYSLNLEERKDFVLGYEITSDGQIIVKFAGGKKWPIPYSEKHEQMLLGKMKKQLENSSSTEQKLKNKVFKNFTIFLVLFGVSLVPAIRTLGGENIQFLICTSSILAGSSLIPGVLTINYKNKLNDLRKNIRFLEIEEKLNEVVRKDQNTFVDVSNKTKNAVKDFPANRPVFNINSFNYVPFSDLEQIMENNDRNERFGFDYDSREEPAQALVRKKVR